jgi:hypothetical protein
MPKIFGYGEDALTLWALKHRISVILNHFEDKTAPSQCLIFFRPSFGRRGGQKSAEFGEFDAIIASKENIYLIESKWDNLTRKKKKDDRIIIRPEQKTRHHVFSWYITHWNKKYSNNWELFRNEKIEDFRGKLKKREKEMPSKKSLLATNLQSVLTMLQNHCPNFSSEHHIKNVLLFFYNKELGSKSPTAEEFEPIPMDYSKGISKKTGNFINLD